MTLEFQLGFDWVDGDSLDLIAGIDEVGRGPLAGPVVAAAVILDPMQPIAGLRDSKRLSARRREALAPRVRECALSWSLGWASVEEIDRLNILQATFLAMSRAVEGLSCRPRHILVDGNQTPAFGIPSTAIVGGDDRVPEIAAASILAKVARDQHMKEMDERYPGYGFGENAGYPTALHRAALEEMGITPIHRRSYAPVRRLLNPGVL